MPDISLETLGAFVLTSLVIALTPCPNMAYLAVTSPGHGGRAGFAVTLGIALGLLVVGIGAALGLATNTNQMAMKARPTESARRTLRLRS